MSSRGTTTSEQPAVDGGNGPRRAAPTLLLALAATPGRRHERRTLDGDGVLIGRDELVFPGGPFDDGRLSRSHAEVRPRGDGWVLRDLGSRNGTWCNGRRLTGERRLEPGDVIRAGSTIVVYALMTDALSSDVAPALVGLSEAVDSIRRSIAAAAARPSSGAAGPATTLVTGETGTGKELVASALHRESRRGGRFVAVNCATLSEGTLASELFGHVRGAFTGATTDRPGLFRAAAGGTLFLDEIGELPLTLQASLLRAVDNGTVRPVGGMTDVAVDVSLVAATNRELGAEVRAGRFRADLYARLSSWIIQVPPLRERREDIPVLIDHLLERSGGRRPLGVTFAEALLVHPWPLNVRGLTNVLSVAALTTPHGLPLDCNRDVLQALEASRAVIDTPEPEAVEAGAEPTREALEEALTRSHGQVSAAARQLGCSRQQLYRYAERHQLDVATFRR